MEALIAIVLIYPLFIALSSFIGWVYRFLFSNPIERSYLPPVYLPKQKDLDKRITLRTPSSPDLMYLSALKKAEYLKSPEWRTLRLLVFTKDNHKCVICGATERLECHHLTYERLTEEELLDLTTLCRACHQFQHIIYGYNRTTNYKTIVRRQDYEHILNN